jgi:hypothetical protein
MVDDTFRPSIQTDLVRRDQRPQTLHHRSTVNSDRWWTCPNRQRYRPALPGNGMDLRIVDASIALALAPVFGLMAL